MKELDDILIKLFRPPRDILISAGMPLIFLIGYIFAQDWVWFRIIFGLPLLFIIPGLLFLEIINYQVDLENRALRFAFCIALSIILVSGIVFFLSVFKGFFTLSFIISLSILVWVESFLLIYKRRRQTHKDDVTPHIFSLGRPQKGDAIFVIGTALILIFASTLLALGVPEERYVGTNFYIIDSNKKAFEYPTHLIPYQEGEVVLVIMCKENKRTNYNVKIWLEENDIPNTILENYSISLDPGNKDEHSFKFNISNYGLFRVIFQLWFNDGLMEELYLWVEVSETKLDALIPSINGTGIFTDPAQVTLNDTYIMAINLTSYELNRTSYHISISLLNSSVIPQINQKILWFEENLSFLLNETNIVLINETLNPSQSSNIELIFYFSVPGIFHVSISASYSKWPYNIANEIILWVRVS